MHFCDMLIGYARVSTDDQDLNLQRAALKGGCRRRLHEEEVSGAKRDQPELAPLLDALLRGLHAKREASALNCALRAGHLRFKQLG